MSPIQIFFDTNVVLAASIDGYLEAITGKAKITHPDHGPSKGLMNIVERLVHAGIEIGVISGKAEYECRKVLVNAINDTIEQTVHNLNIRAMKDADKLKFADTYDLFRLACNENLERNISLLKRRPVDFKRKEEMLKRVSLMFSSLDYHYYTGKYDDQKSFIDSTSRRWKGLRASLVPQDKKTIARRYKPGASRADMEILAEAIIMMLPNAKNFLATFDRNFISEWACKEIIKTFGIRPDKPDNLINIVKECFPRELGTDQRMLN